MKKNFSYVFIIILIILLGVYFAFKYLNVLQDHESIDGTANDSISIKLHEGLDCECDKVNARKNIDIGNIIVYYNSHNPYFEDLAFSEYNIYVQPILPTAKRICAISVMDSVIFSMYGKKFYENLQRKADSIESLKPWHGISLDGFYLYSDKEVKYKCGDFKSIYKLIEDSLMKKGLLPLKQNKCLPGELIIDFVITENGKLIDVRCLKKLNPNIDSTVTNILKKLPCDWEPAENKSKKVSFRKQMYFFFGKQVSSGVGRE